MWKSSFPSPRHCGSSPPSAEIDFRHTSGFGDFFALPELQSTPTSHGKESIGQRTCCILFRVSIESKPGERWAYSNVGYYLLGMIIENVTGEPYETFLKHRIFDPRQMTETRRMDRKDIIPRRAFGYTWENKTIHNAQYTSVTWAFSDGGLVSFVSDLAKADAGLFGC